MRSQCARSGLGLDPGILLAVAVASTTTTEMATAYTEPQRPQQAGTDAFMIARARLGDKDAITELVRSCSQKLRRVAWPVVRNWADAEDVVQGDFWEACQALADYRECAVFSTRLTRVELDESVGLLRKRRTELADLAEADVPPQEVQWPTIQTQTPEQIPGSNELERCVRRCMGRMRRGFIGATESSMEMAEEHQSWLSGCAMPLRLNIAVANPILISLSRQRWSLYASGRTVGRFRRSLSRRLERENYAIRIHPKNFLP